MNLATFIAASLLLAVVPQDAGIVRDRCEVIEINNFCDSDAHPVFVQAIFWDDAGHVIDWRLVKNRADQERANIQIRRDYAGGGYVATWLDSETLREVRSKCWRETWTQHDPELVDREHMPMDRRRKLAAGRRDVRDYRPGE